MERILRKNKIDFFGSFVKKNQTTNKKTQLLKRLKIMYRLSRNCGAINNKQLKYPHINEIVSNCVHI